MAVYQRTRSVFRRRVTNTVKSPSEITPRSNPDRITIVVSRQDAYENIFSYSSKLADNRDSGFGREKRDRRGQVCLIDTWFA